MNPYFILLVLKQVNVAAVVIVLAKVCVPDVVKDLNVKIFNLMSRTNETRHIKWHKTCKCKCRLDANVEKGWQINQWRNVVKMLMKQN